MTHAHGTFAPQPSSLPWANLTPDHLARASGGCVFGCTFGE